MFTFTREELSLDPPDMEDRLIPLHLRNSILRPIAEATSSFEAAANTESVADVVQPHVIANNPEQLSSQSPQHAVEAG